MQTAGYLSEESSRLPGCHNCIYWQNVLPWQENDYLVSHFDDDEDAFMDDDDMDEGPIY